MHLLWDIPYAPYLDTIKKQGTGDFQATYRQERRQESACLLTTLTTYFYDIPIRYNG